MSKRANGEGNVYQRANGTWEARIAYVDPDTSQRKRASFYGPTAKSVRDKMKAARDRSTPAPPSATRPVRLVTGWRIGAPHRWRCRTAPKPRRRSTPR